MLSVILLNLYVLLEILFAAVARYKLVSHCHEMPKFIGKFSNSVLTLLKIKISSIQKKTGPKICATF